MHIVKWRIYNDLLLYIYILAASLQLKALPDFDLSNGFQPILSIFVVTIIFNIYNNVLLTKRKKRKKRKKKKESKKNLKTLLLLLFCHLKTNLVILRFNLISVVVDIYF